MSSGLVNPTSGMSEYSGIESSTASDSGAGIFLQGFLMLKDSGGGKTASPMGTDRGVKAVTEV